MLRTLLLRYRTALLYLAIGGSAALIDFFLFVFFYGSLGIPTTVATTLSITLSTIYGFLMNTFFNFRTFDRLLRRFLSYASVSIFAVITSSLSLLVFTDLLSFNGHLVKALSLPPIALLQYLLNRKYSFSSLRVGGKKQTI